jgi:hypothetical protein
MSLNRKAAPLKSYDRLEREIYRRDEARLPSRWEMEDKYLLGPRPRRGALWPVNEDLLAVPEYEYLMPNVCMHCWTYIIPTNAQPVDHGNNTYLLIAAPKAVRGAHPQMVYQDECVLPDDPQWVHAASAHPRCYRDAGSRATFMPGIYVIEEMGI